MGAVDEVGLARLVRRQDGVVARRQLIDLGATPSDIRRWLRRRDIAVVHKGVYVDHTGRPTRRQREWAAVLAAAPAALHRESALVAAGLTRDRGRSPEPLIHVVVEAGRTLHDPPGARIERVRHAARWILPDRRPPRVTVEFAALKVASGLGESGAIAVLADVCRQGLTTPGRLIAVLKELPRLPGRAGLVALLADVESGAHSVLEQRYLVRVERAHGLPTGQRQVRVDSELGVVFRDVKYAGQHTLVELDGRFGHVDSDDRWADLDRDLEAAVTGQMTIRIGWGQVLEPCRVAIALGLILRSRGWDGTVAACDSGCPVDRAAPVSPRDTDSPQSARGA